MKLIDVILIIIIAVIIGLVCYFHFWKNRNKPCNGCPYCNSCNKSGSEKNAKPTCNCNKNHKKSQTQPNNSDNSNAQN